MEEEPQGIDGGGPEGPASPPETPRPRHRAAPPAWVMIAGAVALAAVLVFAVRRLTVRARLSDLPAAGAGERELTEALSRGKFNIVLQVRARSPEGGMAQVGTTLPGQLTLKFVDAEGRAYLENFDRVGMWAVEVPPGTYWIPLDQDKLGGWKWKVSGDLLERDGGKGWKFTIASGTVHPMIDLLLQ